MSDDAAILRSIAHAPDDDLPRLVYADWLEENGDVARAAFIRVQCELARDGLPEDRWGALRIRERALLDAHRREWVESFPLPLDDVRFRRGLLSQARLSNWNDGKLLAAVVAPQLATLEELDLSALGLTDANLEQFAKRADFPALRKLRLNGNRIGDAGAIALATAEGLPKLTSLDLSDNSPCESGRWILQESPHFTLAELDLGEPAVGYQHSPAQAEAARIEFVRESLLPFVTMQFRKYPDLQSAMLCVAQYWADEADDDVHAYLIVSELPEPVLEGANSGDREESGNDPNVPNTRVKQEFSEGGSALYLYGTGVPWDDNGNAIPLWAAFAPEGGSQEHEDLSDAYAPAVMFYRHGGYEILPMSRPQLDGILPESD